jgi:hypothetical protein
MSAAEDPTKPDISATAFLGAVLELVGQQMGRGAEARLADVLGDRGVAAAVRHRRNELIRTMDREFRGSVSSIRQRTRLVEDALAIGAIPQVADIPGDRLRELARNILALNGGRPPGFQQLRLIITGSDFEDPAEQRASADFARAITRTEFGPSYYGPRSALGRLRQ